MLKVDSIVAPKKIVDSQIIRYVRAKMTKDHDSAVKTLYKIVDGEVEAVEFKVTEHFNYLPNVAVKLPALAVDLYGNFFKLLSIIYIIR